MGHFKRGRAKNRRAGCILCKPWKANGAKDRDTTQEVVAKLSEREQVTEDDSWWDAMDLWVEDYLDEPCSDSSCPECNWRETLTEIQARWLR